MQILTLAMNLLLAAFTTIAAADDSLVKLSFIGNLSGNLSCTADCGNCCTGQTANDVGNNLMLNIGGSAISLNDYFNETKRTHSIRGYSYTAPGSCDMNSCSFFYVTSVDKNNDSPYNSQTQKITIPSVKVDDDKVFTVTLNQPYTIESLTEIAGSGADCSQGQVCMEGYTCTSYTGIAGNSLQNCEISCINKKYCPSGKSCINIADGPQNVCQ